MIYYECYRRLNVNLLFIIYYMTKPAYFHFVYHLAFCDYMHHIVFKCFSWSRNFIRTIIKTQNFGIDRKCDTITSTLQNMFSHIVSNCSEVCSFIEKTNTMMFSFHVKENILA